MAVDLATKDGFLAFLAEDLVKIREMFLEDGLWRPMAIVVATVDPVLFAACAPHIVPMMVAGEFPDEAKEHFAEVIKEMIARLKGIGVCFSAEAWAATSPSLRPQVRPVDNPNRVEVILYTAEHIRLTERFIRYGCIERDKAGRATDVQWKTMAEMYPGVNVTQDGGRFLGLFDRTRFQ